MIRKIAKVVYLATAVKQILARPILQNPCQRREKQQLEDDKAIVFDPVLG